jgi:hypothetical protein
MAVGVVCGGMFLARGMLDVTFVHDLKQSLLRIFAIAIGPSAIYELFTANAGTELAGPLLGILLSIVIYSILYKFLLQLDARDTAICVLMTWILVAGINYAIFRAQGYITGSSI